MIRNYEERDKEKVIEFHERILRETGAFVPGPWNDDMKNIEKVYIRPGGCFVLIKENDSIIATGALKIISKNVAEIKRMRVETSLQRQGLGQKVLDHLLLYAKNCGIERIILDTTDLQKAAQHFYIKNNFIEYGRKKWNGITMILYEKLLDSDKCKE